MNCLMQHVTVFELKTEEDELHKGHVLLERDRIYYYNLVQIFNHSICLHFQQPQSKMSSETILINSEIREQSSDPYAKEIAELFSY